MLSPAFKNFFFLLSVLIKTIFAFSLSSANGSFYFMYASLCTEDSDEEVHVLKDQSVNTRAMTGSIVSSLYRLKDCEHENREGRFFVFPDLSVRMEGRFRLKFTLFEIVG